MKKDIAVKRGRFIGKLNSLAYSFQYASPDTFVKILNIYAVSFYGIWNLFSADCEKIYSAWHVNICHTWSIPKTMHRYLVESISGSLHHKVMLASRYSSFVNSLLNSPRIIKEKIKYFPVPPPRQLADVSICIVSSVRQ